MYGESKICGAKTQKGTECKIRIDVKACRYHLTRAPRYVKRSNLLRVETAIKTWPNRPDFWSTHDKISRIGRGGYSEVLLVRNKETQTLYALKLFKTEGLTIADDSVILEHLHHPGIVECYERLVVDRHGKKVPGLLTQYIKGSNLLWECNQSDTIEMTKVKKWLRSSLEVLDYIHSQGIVHGDIKPGNLMVTDVGDIVFLDFGLSHFFEDRSDLIQLGACTPLYSAPEIFIPREKNFESLAKADIFSLGVTFYFIISRKKPNWAFSKPEKKFLPETFAKSMEEFAFPEDPVLVNTVKRMLSFSSLDRPSVKEALEALE